VTSPLNNKTPLTELTGNPLGKHGTRKACANNKEIERHENGDHNDPAAGASFSASDRS
jgi:hypothetical protein